MNKAKQQVVDLIVKAFNVLPASAKRGIISSFPRSAKLLTGDLEFTYKFSSVFFGNAQMRLMSTHKIDREIIYHQHYDTRTLLTFKQIIKSGDVCLDIGANIGSLSIPMAVLTSETGRVYSFEPGPNLFSRLKRNIGINKLNNIHAYNFGLSNTNGKLFFSPDEINLGNAFLSAQGKEEVDIKRIDDLDFSKNEQKIDFIKIDVEGMELEVLEGGIEMLKKHLPSMIIETNISDNYNKIESIFKLLSALDYSFFEIIVRDPDLHEETISLKDIDKKISRLDYRFIPTHFPKLPQNTIAIHKSKVAVLH